MRLDVFEGPLDILLHLVRDEDGEMGLSPAPSIYDLPNLVQSYCDDGGCHGCGNCCQR